MLLHIGLDTVKMRGEGFDAKVKVGDRVRTGDELIAFDLDKVATGAKSLLTQIVIANSDLLTSFTPRRPGDRRGRRRRRGRLRRRPETARPRARRRRPAAP